MASEVRVREASLPGDVSVLLRTWRRAHRGDPYWVPPLAFERRRFLDPAKNPYFGVADVQFFVASVAGEDVGTLAVTVDHGYQAHDLGMGFFGFFEFIDDEAVARALLEAGRAWLRERGMTRAMGPFNFNTNHDFGLLVDGFESPPFIANPHNAAYFEPIYRALGLEPNMDWYAYWVPADGDGAQRVGKVAERFLSRHPEVTIRDMDLAHWEREVEIIHAIYDDAWEQNWSHVRVTDEEFDFIASGFKDLVDTDFAYVVEVNGEPAGMSLTIPNLNIVIQKAGGKLFPFGWYPLLFGRRSIDVVRVLMLGVRQQYQDLPLGALMYHRTWSTALRKGVRGGEASLILQSNDRMNGALERMGEVYKTYRTFEMAL